MTIGIVLLKGPRRGVFLISEVPLQRGASARKADPNDPAVSGGDSSVLGLGFRCIGLRVEDPSDLG